MLGFFKILIFILDISEHVVFLDLMTVSSTPKSERMTAEVFPLQSSSHLPFHCWFPCNQSKKCFQKICTRFFFRCLICWQFLVAAGSGLGLWTHTIHFVFCFFMDMVPPIAPHRWEAVLTQTLGLKAMISPQEHTSQIYFYRSMYKIHPACLWENPLTPLSLRLSLSAVGLLFTLSITTSVAEFPFSLPHWTSVF